MIEKRTIEVFDYLRLVIKWRKLFVLLVATFAGASATISFFLPRQYRAESTVVVRDWSVEPSRLVSSELLTLSLWSSTQAYSAYYAGILASRKIAESVVRKHDLVSVYGSKDISTAIEALRRNVEILTDDEGILHVWATDRSPQRSRDIANDFVLELENTVTEFEVEKARSNRTFIQTRLDEVAEELKEAEEALRDYQSHHGLVSLSSQVETAVAHWAEIRSEMMALEIQKRILERREHHMHPQLLSVERRLTELKRSLDLLQIEGSVDGNRYSLPLGGIPELELEHARLKREAMVKENLYRLLSQEYERARVEEARDTPRLVVLDRATIPEEKHAPDTVVIVFSSILVAFLLASVIMVISEHSRPVKSPGGLKTISD